MAALLLCLTLSATPATKFADGGFRSASGSTFAELARLAHTAHGDNRLSASQQAFDAFARYASPIYPQFQPRCHCSRVFETLKKWDYLRQIQEPKPDALTHAELQDFKKACYSMLRVPDQWTRQRALEHIVMTADQRDLRPLLALLHDPMADRGLVCLGLGRVGSDEAVPAIARELGGKWWEEAKAALEAIGSDAAKEALAKTRRDSPRIADSR